MKILKIQRIWIRLCFVKYVWAYCPCQYFQSVQDRYAGAVVACFVLITTTEALLSEPFGTFWDQ